MTPNPNSAFGNAIDWFLHRDRKADRRRSAAFHLWWLHELPDKTKPGIGLEVSTGGLVFIFPETIAPPEYTLICHIREKKIRVRVRTTRSEPVAHKGAQWMRYTCKFTGIAADDWDLIVRYVNEVPELESKAASQEAAEPVDDAYRLLPMAIQNKITAMLIAQKKLEAPKPGVSPLLKLFYGGASKKDDGSVQHRFNVHSRIKINDETVAYDTRFLVDESGAVSILK